MDLARALEKERMKRKKSISVGSVGVCMRRRLKCQKYGLNVDYVVGGFTVGVRVSQPLLHLKLTIFAFNVKNNHYFYSSYNIIIHVA